MIPESEWVWQGHAGHLVVASQCRFHLATRVGDVLISTAGDYYPAAGKERDRLGCGPEDFFETMVFRARGTQDCGCAAVEDFREVDQRRYATAREAQAGHMALCRHYAGLPAPEAAE
jgi:hypothetical protein